MRIPTEEVLERFRDPVFAAAFCICKNAADADDAVQETFLKYHLSETEFDSEQHIRAWLIRVGVNQAKNIKKSFWHRRTVSLADYMETLTFADSVSEDLFSEVMRLPDKYRLVIHLFYYEDYSVEEIAKLAGISPGSVKMRLSRARKMLKARLKEEWNDDE